MNEDANVFSKFLLGLIKKVGFQKLDKLATVNVILIFVLAMFALLQSIGDALLVLLYAIGDIFSQIFGKNPVNPSVDTTPFWQYAFFLMLGFSICMFIVNKNNKKQLW